MNQCLDLYQFWSLCKNQIFIYVEHTMTHNWNFLVPSLSTGLLCFHHPRSKLRYILYGIFWNSCVYLIFIAINHISSYADHTRRYGHTVSYCFITRHVSSLPNPYTHLFSKTFPINGILMEITFSCQSSLATKLIQVFANAWQYSNFDVQFFAAINLIHFV